MDGNIEKMQSLTGRIKALAIDTTLTKKGMCAEAEATGEALATKVNITDIVDDLTSVADDKPLSANQGRILKKQIDEIDPHYAENVIYDDTNVKDAIDKLSKAENIDYDEEKSVKGAIDELNENVEDVQTQINTVQTQLNTIFTSVDYTIQTTSNSSASPYTRYGELDISSHINAYGTPISINASNSSGIPVPCSFSTGSKRMKVCSNLGEIYAKIVYVKIPVTAK